MMSDSLAEQLARWRADRMAFRREAILLEDGTPFGDRVEPWQEEDFRALDSATYLHAYLERPRGHSKTGDVGTEAVTELLLGPPGQQLYCAAADEDQAKLLFGDVASKFQRNPLLRGSVRITQRDIIVPVTGSRLRVLASDAPSAYGLRPDWIAVDELAEWRGRELWDSLWTATGKRPRCRMVVITTAGWDATSICWQVRQVAEREADWYFSHRGQCASWIRPGWLASQRRTLPGHVFARLHECRWVEGAGAFLTREEVERLFTLPTPAPLGARYVIGLDIGLTRDRTAACVAHREGETVVADLFRTWAGRPGMSVDLGDVEAEVIRLAHTYRAPVILDPYQGILLGQRLQRVGITVTEQAFSAESRRRLFGVVLQLVKDGRLRSAPHEALSGELLSLEVTETAAGWRVDHRPGRHDDHVIALALAAHKLTSERQLVYGVDFGIL
ncbi:MAG TPA: terminase large subunit [Gemmatimonadales bacterium]|nr:terminase large subunit [Gemmatimonadales bacterium]